MCLSLTNQSDCGTCPSLTASRGRSLYKTYVEVPPVTFPVISVHDLTLSDETVLQLEIIFVKINLPVERKKQLQWKRQNP